MHSKRVISTRCKTCPFICNVEKLTGPKRSIKTTDHFTCTSSSVIYCITYTLCKNGYTSPKQGDDYRYLLLSPVTQSFGIMEVFPTPFNSINSLLIITLNFTPIHVYPHLNLGSRPLTCSLLYINSCKKEKEK